MRALDVPPEHASSEQALADLLEAASRGDTGAWEQVIGLYASRVFALARSRCRNVDLAEEITQSVFVTLAAKVGAGEYVEQGRFEAWLFRIVMNRIRDEMRRRKRQAEPTDPRAMPDQATQPPPAGPDPEIASLRAALMELSDRDREVIELRHHAGLSFKQMADLLDEPIGTLLARHHRALAKVRNLMEAPDDPGEDGKNRPAHALNRRQPR